MKSIKSKSFLPLLLLIIFSSSLFFTTVSAATNTLTTPTDAANPTKSSFRIVVCDGPSLAGLTAVSRAAYLTSAGKSEADYIACDFNGAMLTVRHLIDIMMVLGVIAAVCLCSWAGALYVTGTKGNIDKAKEMLLKVLTGFAIMLCAWFVVFQIITWLVDNQAVTYLLGK